ncbi:hypothetical protein PIB30_013632 [Stylosanthes scabra]|uniref:Glycosyltransferase n=1 Tax=Stylosanthes scabra TaxID=79078 RepID=A0ABU6U947_9FABA|nr:hypothetical protein [Stylosanthes scabra]
MVSSTPQACNKNLHFVFIPLMAPGHILPMVDMAKLLARRNNVKVSIVTTPLNAPQFKASLDREVHQNSSQIQIVLIKFPNSESRIPQGCESLDTLPSMDLKVNFFLALSLLRKPIEDLIEQNILDPFPSCLIYDKNIPCVSEVATKFNVPRIIFDGTNCFNLLCNHNLYHSKVSENLCDDDYIVVPGLPHRIEMKRSQLPALFNPGTNQHLIDVREKIRENEKGAYGVVVNSFEELESEYVREYQRVTGSKVWCLGPVSLTNKDDVDKAQRGNNKFNHDDEIVNKYVKFLDSWPKGSVIYACLGSLNRVSPKQLIEIGLGLEVTKRPFIWVLRGAYRKDEMEKWLSENGFEERVKDRGILIKGWAPQILILSHSSIGAFLTHCGWNSTLEGICSGVPLITFPMFADQFYNEKLVVQVIEIGVRIGVENAVHFGDEHRFGDGVQVTREKVMDAVEKVMGEGEEEEKRRERAKEYGDLAKKAIEEGGSSYNNLSFLVENIINNHVSKV